MEPRSSCPINLAVEVLGDRWSVILLRDIMFGNRRTFREILTRSEEGIASNILSARLKHLEAQNMITQAQDPSHKQKKIISLTTKSIDLVPVFAALGAWGVQHLPVSAELSIRAQLLNDGGPDMWARFMAELRALHLGPPHQPPTRSVIEELTLAYLNEVAKLSGTPPA